MLGDDPLQSRWNSGETDLPGPLKDLLLKPAGVLVSTLLHPDLPTTESGS